MLSAEEVTTIIEKEIHPIFVETILFDRYIEYRLKEMVDIERFFQQKYGKHVFIQCDMESNVVHYEISSLDLIISCSFPRIPSSRDISVGKKGREDG